MREIKYRQATFKDGLFLWWHYWGFVGYRGKFVGPINIGCIGDIYEVKPSQQYTGLVDKNGKEIYEGDILLAPNYLTMSDPMGESDFCSVVMETGAFGYQQRGMFESFISLYGHGCTSVDEEEVIGSIYENPELIT